MGGFLGSGPSLDTSGAQKYMDTLNGIATGLGSQGAGATSDYNANNAQNKAAMNAYSQYLLANPATEQYNATQVANAERDASQGAVRAQANMDQNLAQRGIAPNSSIAAGENAAVTQALARNNANIQSEVGQRNIDRHNQNLAANANLWSGATRDAFGRSMDLTNTQDNIYSNLLSAEDQQAIAKYQAAIAAQNGLVSGAATLGAAFA